QFVLTHPRCRQLPDGAVRIADCSCFCRASSQRTTPIMKCAPMTVRCASMRKRWRSNLGSYRDPTGVLTNDSEFSMPNINERGGMRAIFAPATAQSDAIVRPSCSQCGTTTVLVGIEPEPERHGYDLHTFQCPKCQNFELAVAKAAS